LFGKRVCFYTASNQIDGLCGSGQGFERGIFEEEFFDFSQAKV